MVACGRGGGLGVLCGCLSQCMRRLWDREGLLRTLQGFLGIEKCISSAKAFPPWCELFRRHAACSKDKTGPSDKPRTPRLSHAKFLVHGVFRYPPFLHPDSSMSSSDAQSQASFFYRKGAKDLFQNCERCGRILPRTATHSVRYLKMLSSLPMKLCPPGPSPSIVPAHGRYRVSSV